MTDEQIKEAMARFEGWDQAAGLGWVSIEGIEGRLPNYLEDHNAVQRVIDGFDEREIGLFTRYLWEECACDSDFLKATPCQKCEAILKAKGLWTDD